MPQAGIQKRQRGLAHPKSGGTDSQHTPSEALRPHRRNEDEQQKATYFRVVRPATMQNTVSVISRSPMQLAAAMRKDASILTPAACKSGDNDSRNASQQFDIQHPLLPSHAQMDLPSRAYAARNAEIGDVNTMAHQQQTYPTAVSYVQGQSHESVNAHYVHAPLHMTAPPGHHAYAWHQAQLQQYQNPAMHHHAHQIAHHAYAYPMQHTIVQPLSHVPHAQMAPISHTIWSPMPLPPHVHGHGHHSNHAAYTSPIPLPGQDIPKAQYAHYVQQKVPLGQQTHSGAPSSNPPPLNLMNNPHAPPENFATSRSPEPEPYNAKPLETQKAKVAGVSKLSSLKTKPLEIGFKRNASLRMTENHSTAEKGAPSSGSVKPAGSVVKSDPKSPLAPPNAMDRVKTSDGGESTASNKPAVNRRHAGSSIKHREKQATQPIRKSRKPYTLTKSRESWTDKEHVLFLEALQLYNRDWKRIEAHVGTKTVLQIRSHAQKHFCKVAKYNTGEYIPPARPKRRASQPYWRSRGTSNTKPLTSNGDIASGRSQDRTTVTTGSGMASDSGAGSSDNGNVSGTGHAKGGSGATSDGRGKLLPHEPPADERRSVDRCSDSLPHQSDKSKDRNATEKKPDSNANPRLGKTGTTLPIPFTCLNMPFRAAPVPGSYEHYYVNVVRPNGLPYGTEFYHGSHYPVQHPQYTWHDGACGQRNCRNQAGGYSGILPGGHYSPSHGRDPQETQLRGPSGPSNWPPDPRRNARDEDNGNTSSAGLKRQQTQLVSDTPLAVLSNCIDMVARQKMNKPAPGWASAAAARRAHRARVIRERKQLIVHNEKQHDNMGNGKTETGMGQRNESAKRMRRTAIDENGKKTEGRDSAAEKATQGSPNQTIRAEEPKNTDVLIGPAEGPSNVGVVDVGSDEAVAGFSGSDRQESGSDGVAGGSAGGSITPETLDEDPNSSNDGSGEDGRRNTRSPSEIEPNSSESPEESPSGAEILGSHNRSSRKETPVESREATPTDSGDASTGKVGSSNTGTGNHALVGGPNLAGCPKMNGDNSADDTIMVPTEILSSFSGSRTARNASSGPKNRSLKTKIGSLLNNEPCDTF